MFAVPLPARWHTHSALSLCLVRGMEERERKKVKETQKTRERAKEVEE